MAQTKSLDEAEKVLVILMVLVRYMPREVLILKIDISDTRSILLFLWFIITVLVHAGGEAFELHDILGQSAGFVREYIVDHSELLVKVR